MELSLCWLYMYCLTLPKYYTTAKFSFTQKTHNNVVFATIFSATPGGQEKPFPVRKPGSGQDVTVSPDRTYANSYYIWNI